MLYEQLGLILPRRVLRWIVESTQGNALFALELGRSLAEDGLPEIGEEVPMPPAIEELLGTRVAGLAAPVRRVLLAVALNPDLTRSQLAAVADASAIDGALDAGLVLVRGDRVRASHPLMAAAARSQAEAGERRDLHRAVAGVVTDHALRARHLALATDQPDTELASALSAAAVGSAAHGRAEDAVELAEHAVRLTPLETGQRACNVLALAEYLIVAGEPQRAAEVLAPEIDRVPAGPDRARIHLLLGAESRLAVTHADECGRHLELALAESGSDPALHATAVARLARHTAVVRVERIGETEALCLEALPAARAAGPRVEREVLHGLAWARSLRGQPVDDLVERFRAVSDDAFEIFRSPDRIVAERLVSRGELAAARSILERLLAVADERGEAWSFVRLRLGLCEIELRAGRWDRAERLLDAWAQSPDRDLLTRPAYERCRALLTLGRGDARTAEEWAARAIVASDARGLRWDALEALRVRGIAALHANDPLRAAESLGAVWEHTEREGVDEPGVFPVAPDLVGALIGTGARAEAHTVAKRLRRLADEQRHPWGLASAARCDAVLRLTESYDDGAAGDMLRAADAYGDLGLHFDRARTLLVLGRAARRQKKWGPAREALDRAASAFDETGSPGWAEQARSELARVGARRRAPAGELTPAERRVAQLASEGLANKEIAQRLVVTVHTVEVHLSHAYAKLGVRSRTQLAGRL
jgi:DNA-binding NarL/FixJ family response regulator